MTSLIDLRVSPVERPSIRDDVGLDLRVTTGVGEGPNELAAFDAALFRAGIANFNLIYLSSVIPAGSRIKRSKVDLRNAGWGDRLYIVIAQERVKVRNQDAWAGVGWVQEHETGNGLFVEHHGSSQDQVEELIDASLTSMVKYRDRNFGPIDMQLAGTRCVDDPVCALVAVVYGSESWNVTGVNDVADVA